MHLAREQERWLRGEEGPALEWATGVLARLGDRTGASRLIPVSSVHIPCWAAYDAPEAWSSLRAIARTVPFPVTANPGPEGPLANGRKIVLESLRPQRAYSFSCAPHLVGNHPGRGASVAWGGRAATAFANSVLGARSEMESFETAAAAAVTGLTVERGLHLEENRHPTVAVVMPRSEKLDPIILAWTLSRQLKGVVPLLCGISPTFDDAKRLAFALNAQGQVPMFKMQRDPSPPAGMERVEIDESMLAMDAPSSPDLAILGCPHLSEQDINRWSKRLSGRTPSRAEAWFFTSRLCLDKCPIFGAVLRSRGRIFVDQCPLEARDELRGRTIVCDSPALASCLRENGIRATYLPEQEMLDLLTA